MNYIEKILDGVHSVFNVNEATLSGAVDVIAVRQSDGMSETEWCRFIYFDYYFFIC